MANCPESGLARNAIAAPLAKNMVEDAVETPRYTQAVSEMLVLVASALDIPDVFLSGDQPDFLGYYDPLTRALLYTFKAYGLNCLTS
jgi:hypothetical protein